MNFTRFCCWREVWLVGQREHGRVAAVLGILDHQGREGGDFVPKNEPAIAGLVLVVRAMAWLGG